MKLCFKDLSKTNKCIGVFGKSSLKGGELGIEDSVEVRTIVLILDESLLLRSLRLLMTNTLIHMYTF